MDQYNELANNISIVNAVIPKIIYLLNQQGVMTGEVTEAALDYDGEISLPYNHSLQLCVDGGYCLNKQLFEDGLLVGIRYVSIFKTLELAVIGVVDYFKTFCLKK